MLKTTLKPKTCSACAKEFMPARPMQAVCSPRCARQKVKADKAAERQKIKERKEKVKTRSQWLAEAQQAVNAWVRWRDRALGCISCRKPATADVQWHAGHYRSRGSAKHLALDERNIHKQCATCNNILSGNLLRYRKGLIKRIGLKAVEALESDHEPRKYTIDDLREKRDHYRRKLREAKCTS